ncbi:MAG TPA: response regulator transcription factor [Candidatus Intestinimonas merdavium]|uniref:Stage 0 sporulation protein A homolog n=1 Tax=Candidatus Intestinimonas merdavium TaxID=2838622 RepID=A0A9D1Z445_9FIRM|nr:response regulator transcription factor [Candidatus Intestinimonas merdavium]
MPDIILIVEDEPHMGTILQDYFAAHGVESDLASDGDTALDAFARRDYDAVLLDVMIPGLDGYGVCRAIRRESSLPILFLTALGGEEQALYGYSLGADDYVTKPFSLALLLAKTTALIRRSRGTEDGALICGAIRLEPGPMLCTVSHNQVKLSPREYQLLLCLLRNRGKVLSREQLLTRVWGWDFEGGDRAVDVQVKNLRAALGDAGKQIKTVFKAGYKLEAE